MTLHQIFDFCGGFAIGWLVMDTIKAIVRKNPWSY